MAKEADNEILAFAIAREIEAYRFYTALVQNMADPKMQKIFDELAQEELEHKAKLELEYIKTGRTLPADSESLEPPPDYINYIVHGAEPPLDMSYKEMIMLGMQKEDAAFRTYVDLVSQAENKESRDTLFALAEEEVKHKMRFEVEYAMLLKKK